LGKGTYSLSLVVLQYSGLLLFSLNFSTIQLMDSGGNKLWFSEVFPILFGLQCLGLISALSYEKSMMPLDIF
jgi:hypothetical protein